MNSGIYHEKQVLLNCGLHMLNNLFQDPQAFSKVSPSYFNILSLWYTSYVISIVFSILGWAGQHQERVRSGADGLPSQISFKFGKLWCQCHHDGTEEKRLPGSVVWQKKVRHIFPKALLTSNKMEHKKRHMFWCFSFELGVVRFAKSVGSRNHLLNGKTLQEPMRSSYFW